MFPSDQHIKVLNDLVWFERLFSATNLCLCDHIIKMYEIRPHPSGFPISATLGAVDRDNLTEIPFYTAYAYLEIYEDRVCIIDFFSRIEGRGNARRLYQTLFRFILDLNKSQLFCIERVTGSLSPADISKWPKLINLYSDARYNLKDCRFDLTNGCEKCTTAEILLNTTKYLNQYLHFSVHIPL